MIGLRGAVCHETEHAATLTDATFHPLFLTNFLWAYTKDLVRVKMHFAAIVFACSNESRS